MAAGILFLVIAYSPETDPSTPPIRQYGNGLLIATLFCACFGTIYAWQKIVGDPPQGLIVTKVPELAALQQSLTGIKGDLNEILTSTTSAAKGIESLNKSAKKETSEDPRKELSNIGLLWDAEGFLKSIENGDKRAINLYLAGGMRPDARTDQSVLFYAIARDAPDLEWTLKQLINYGLNLDHPLYLQDLTPSLYPNINWKTPVYVAAVHGKLDTLRLLAQLGASTNPMIQEFGAIINKIDSDEAENVRMRDQNYCVKKVIKERIKDIIEFSKQFCAVDLDACADAADPSRGYRHSAAVFCEKSLPWEKRFQPVDWGRFAPARRPTYVNALEALGKVQSVLLPN